MEKGLTAQLMNSVTPMPRHWLRTCVNAPKSILMSIGMIMTQIRMPTGILTCANSIRASAWNAAGNARPARMPAMMQSATQMVR